MRRSAGIGWGARVSSGIGVALALGCSAGGKSQPLGVVPGSPPGAAGSSSQAPAGEVTPPIVMSSGNTMPGGFIDGSDVPADPDLSASGGSRGLQQRQVSCPGGGTTSVSGTVYIPSGKLPLYNAMVYVPDGDLQPRTPGVSCNCEVSGNPIASALTNSSGQFVLENVPVGDNIPLVIQVGDWRREFKLGTVTACADNPVPDQTLRLPSRQSEGDLPKIAVVTGLADALECLVRKLGVDASEFTNPGGGGSVSLFAGEGGTLRYATANQGAAFPDAQTLWSDVASLSKYDVVLMSCDAHHDNVSNKTDQALQAMQDYLNAGGRVFGSHYQEVWFERGPQPFPSIATFKNQNDLGTVAGEVTTSFPKGLALSEWLVASGASASAGAVTIQAAQHTIEAENPAYAQRWIASGAPKESVQYISANTPLGASDSEQCGRVVLSDIHVSTGDPGSDLSDVDPQYDFPNGCVTTEFSPQEAVLAFMLFDLSACIVPDHVAPAPPPTILR
jgi:hypothetical protein